MRLRELAQGQAPTTAAPIEAAEATQATEARQATEEKGASVMNVDRLLTFVIRAMHGLLAATALFVICQPTFWTWT